MCTFRELQSCHLYTKLFPERLLQPEVSSACGVCCEVDLSEHVGLLAQLPEPCEFGELKDNAVNALHVRGVCRTTEHDLNCRKCINQQVYMCAREPAPKYDYVDA